MTENRKGLDEKEARERLKRIEAFALDQDGTTYLENQPFPWTLRFLDGLRERGIKYLFLSNNSSKSTARHVEKLAGLGIDVSEDQVLHSGQVTLEYLKTLPGREKIYLMAVPEVEEEYRAAGFDVDAEDPNYVVLAYDLTFTFEKLEKACRYVRRGVPFFATHHDATWMIGPGEFLPDVGALAAAVTAATGVEAEFLGKPSGVTVEALLRRLGVEKDRVALVGDRLDTDIRMGWDQGILTFLVLSGKTKAEEVEGSPWKPTFVVERTVDILDYLE